MRSSPFGPHQMRPVPPPPEPPALPGLVSTPPSGQPAVLLAVAQAVAAHSDLAALLRHLAGALRDQRLVQDGEVLAEVAGGMNRLLRSAGAKHDPLIFAPPILVALMLVSIWFDVWAVRRIPNLFSFPFGTIVGIYTLVVLLSGDAKAVAWA